MKTTTDYDTIKTALDCIEGAFIWSESPQGLDYWSDVCINLRAMLPEVVEDKTV